MARTSTHSIFSGLFHGQNIARGARLYMVLIYIYLILAQTDKVYLISAFAL